jgi:hypothetical protein
MNRWAKGLIGVGSVCILVGSLDPMEGSLLILPGTGLVAWGTYVGHLDQKICRDWALIFLLCAVGVGELWELSAFGGFGGDSGHSMWWGVLILPYVAGWILAVARILAALIGMIRDRIRGHEKATMPKTQHEIQRPSA